MKTAQHWLKPTINYLIIRLLLINFHFEKRCDRYVAINYQFMPSLYSYLISFLSIGSLLIFASIFLFMIIAKSKEINHTMIMIHDIFFLSTQCQILHHKAPTISFISIFVFSSSSLIKFFFVVHLFIVFVC
jgi:hypothetical protein